MARQTVARCNECRSGLARDAPRGRRSISIALQLSRQALGHPHQHRHRNLINHLRADRRVQRRVALITPSFHSALFSLPDSDLILPMPANILNSVHKLGLPLRSFEIPVPLERVTVLQAWHPRFHNDPAHRWLRQTLKACCSVDP